MNRRLFAAAALAAATSVTVPVAAQTAAEAFECKLPYKAAMQSAAKLPVLKQQTSSPATALLGETSTIELAPGGMNVLGTAPTRLFILIMGPTTRSRDKSFSTTFSAIYPRTPAVETLLARAGWTSACTATSRACGRAVDVAGSGVLQFVRDDPKELRITCRYSLRESDLN